MPIILALGLIALGIAALMKRGGTTPSTGPVGGTPTGSAPPPVSSGGGGAGVGGAVGSVALGGLKAVGLAGLKSGAGALAGIAGVPLAGVAGTTAAFAASAGIGALITGDAAGAAGGALGLATTIENQAGFITAQAGNVGREVGAWLDKLFGGTGKGASGTVYQITGFTIAMATASYGLIATGILAPIGLLVLAITSAISDNGRLAYGQAGARRDFVEELAKLYHSELDTAIVAARATLGGVPIAAALSYAAHPILKGLNDKLPQLDPGAEAELRAAAAAGAVGYKEAENSQKRAMHGKQAWGITIRTWAEHYRWAELRGVYVTEDATLAQLLHDFLGSAGASAIRPEQLAAHRAGGAFRANVNAYLQAMTERWGIGANARSHAEYWRDRVGAFTGVIDSDGNLITQLGRVDWRASQQSGTVVVTT